MSRLRRQPAVLLLALLTLTSLGRVYAHVEGLSLPAMAAATPSIRSSTTAHTNLAFMFGEDKRLVPADDSLSILPGYFGSHPNFACEVPASEIEAFHGSLTAVTDAAGREVVAARWGIRRASPRFWEFFDRVHEDFRKRQPSDSGIFDRNRYENL